MLGLRLVHRTDDVFREKVPLIKRLEALLRDLYGIPS